jgi:signal transduction histidine kinase
VDGGAGPAESYEPLDATRLLRLLDVGRSLVSELDLESLLRAVLEAARDLAGARYAALGVLNDEHDGLERFLTLGIDKERHAQIGDLPRGHGVLGVLISDPRPLRLADVGMHPRSYGFPAGHPPMTTFLGVPIRIRESVYGNLYLTDKVDGEFTEADEAALVVLAEWAGFAIENARLYRDATQRRDDLQHAVAAFEAALTVARAVGGETRLDRILELIVKRGRALVDARSMFVALETGGQLTINAVAGELDHSFEHQVVPLGDSPAAGVLQLKRPRHLAGEGDGTVSPVPGVKARAALIVPMMFRGVSSGVLCALDPPSGGSRFSPDAERVLEAFATSAATAVATGKNVAAERARRATEASESERRRWARELHDETLQDMASLKLILSTARRSGDPAVVSKILDEAIDQMTHSIAALRHLINDLRPPILDEAGVQPALEHLVSRVARMTELDLRVELDLAYASGRATTRLSPQVEDTLYRVVQEALTNVVKHAQATCVQVTIVEQGDRIDLRVADDGRGIGAREAGADGYGLVAMRERIEMVGGSLVVADGGERGTEVCVSIPVSRVGDAATAARPAPIAVGQRSDGTESPARDGA